MKTRKNPDEKRALDVLGQFRIIFKTVNRHFDNLEKRTGISGSQVWALAEIAAKPGMTVNDLSRVMSLHQSTTSNLLEKLESQGLVKKIRSESDRRSITLAITSKGSKALLKAPGPHRGILPDALLHLGQRDLIRLQAALDILVTTLAEKSRKDAKSTLRDP